MLDVFDESRAWAMDPRVALRAESFGALAYHFGTRRLSFLKHPMLVAVVEQLGQHPSASAACDAVGVPAARRAQIHAALGTLADTGMIVHREGEAA
ncbi:MAG TPA: mycofactocin biosynthesis chaperone MftB [Baekduia sp.]|uniref:mycofactocin biosynthesis chaperone MftB n=1 Tax=Baekduia sp. TaxID=2600305 RepID=UPI002D796F8A|nr:mycofactocin biosynthesis chaperone MftB [Baekduia sp.]HET6506966.1 mycofactocin biosynthesis chaperone MftB [Baekduia sp.]